MANNKYAGYTPKKEELGMGNRLDRINPFEFRKGMDYELTAVGCSRLAESTIEEREKATESVLKNLDTHDGYYTSLITYETLFRNKVENITKPSFTAWLKTQDINKMQEVKPGDKDSKHKEDKMTELKEAIKRRIKSKLREAKKDKDEDDVAFDDGDEKDVEKKAAKAGKSVEKGMVRFEDEKKAIDELLFGEAIPLSDKQRAKGDKEISEQNPSEGSLLYRKNANLEIYKQDKDVDNYKALIKLDEKEIKALEEHIETFGIDGLGNDVKLDKIKGDDLPSTIKKLQARKTSIDKEVADETARIGEQRNEIAATDMTRENQLRLLEICKANGVNLREGSDSIKHYYEIAKTSFLEGLAKGMKL
tara:strand:- start:2240 stop:3328 length:1089 start_codon:yes stop_codon:yes gene_type:complete